MSRSPAHISKSSHHEEQPGSWLPRSKEQAPAELVATLPEEDRYLSIALPLWDWDYLQNPAVQRPSELWIAEWIEWPDNMEGD